VHHVGHCPELGSEINEYGIFVRTQSQFSQIVEMELQLDACATTPELRILIRVRKRKKCMKNETNNTIKSIERMRRKQ
jgi:hypothetical protein